MAAHGLEEKDLRRPTFGRVLDASKGSSDVPFWAHELSYSSLASTDSGYTQQPWLPDGVSGHCMLCAQPFHLLRWTHHCRDCGGLFCASCSSHRVESKSREASATSALRICDNCAFSVHHPRHLGCDNPFGCPRCGPPTTAGQLLIYLQMLIRFVLCCGGAESCACIGATCIAALDERAPAAPRSSPAKPLR
uniref:FYVE-type domain-containing protein n=1 Tax=Calcidiscus leptoporus TaxID=127549 RepID=A0A7S0JAP1_9EUKA|mmetsp:Transcript_46818/g.108771  ORF Transcript_46818/g.108771 Transcript_46818/m.108771 type:complete len:192 (+) Transcript_46818:2-577(+)